jgi:hypothetical protein
MVKIEYNNTQIVVPESWADVTLGTYEKFYKIKPETHRERVAQTALVCSIDPELLFGWPTEVFNEVIKIADFIFKPDTTEPTPIVEAGGVNYVVSLEDSLTLGEYVDADEVQKQSEAVLSNILAIVCRPAGEAYNPINSEARAAMFAALPVEKVLGVLAFFLQCKQTLEAHIAACSNLDALADLLPQNIKSLRKLTGGIRLFQIWRVIHYLILIRLLRRQLRKYSRSYNTSKTKKSPRKHKGNSINLSLKTK